MSTDALFSRIFSPHAVEEALVDDLAVGLRAIADSLERGEIEGAFYGIVRCPLRNWNTDKVRCRIVIDVAGPADTQPTLPQKAR